MASNYKNSAGTDLDSIFLVNNSNAGAIGFTVSGGQDLGNRYSNASTKLNQTIGYKNSAGTDIGYLRSNQTPTSSGSITTKWITDYTVGYYGSSTIDGVKIGYFLYRYDGQEDVDLRSWVYSSQSISNVKVNSLAYTTVTQITRGYWYDQGYRYSYRNNSRPNGKNNSGYGTYTISFTKE